MADQFVAIVGAVDANGNYARLIACLGPFPSRGEALRAAWVEVAKLRESEDGEESIEFDVEELRRG